MFELYYHCLIMILSSHVCLCDTEALFTKSVPSTMKMTVKGGAAVDPDSGIIDSNWFCYYNTTAKRDLIHKTGTTWHITMPPEENRATTTGVSLQNFVKIGPAVPEICLWTDRQTDRQTDHSTPLPYWGGVMITVTVTIVTWCMLISVIFVLIYFSVLVLVLVLRVIFWFKFSSSLQYSWFS